MKKLNELGRVSLLIVSIFFIYALVMVFLKTQGIHAVETRPFFDRYLICLVPIGIIGMVISSRELVAAAHSRLVHYGLVLLLGGILAVRILSVFYKLYPWLIFQATGHS